MRKLYFGLAVQQSAPKVRSYYCLCVLERGQDSRSSGLLREAECKKETKKTIGKNVGHKDADNKVWGDREAALQNAGKVRWQVDKMAFDVDSSACINILNLRPFLAPISINF